MHRSQLSLNVGEGGDLRLRPGSPSRVAPLPRHLRHPRRRLPLQFPRLGPDDRLRLHDLVLRGAEELRLPEGHDRPVGPPGDAQGGEEPLAPAVRLLEDRRSDPAHGGARGFRL